MNGVWDVGMYLYTQIKVTFDVNQRCEGVEVVLTSIAPLHCVHFGFNDVI